MASAGKCPHCGEEDNYGSPSFTLWGGMLGHKLISHVVCNACARGFISTTGEPSTNRIIAYIAVSIGVTLMFMFVFFGLMAAM